MPDLYFSTPYPEDVSVLGLRAHANTTRSFRAHLLSPSAEIAQRAPDHQGKFISLTSSRLESLLHAFRIGPDPERPDLNVGRAVLAGRITPDPELDDDSDFVFCALVVGKLAPFRELLAGCAPTRFRVADSYARNFRNVPRPDGTPSFEWVSETPVPARYLEAEPVRLEQLAGKVEVFEYTGEVPSVRETPPHILHLVSQGVIRSVNPQLGLPHVRWGGREVFRHTSSGPRRDPA